MTGVPRWVIVLLGAALLLFGVASYMGWLRDPSLARSDYIGTIDVSTEDARLYRPVSFEWRVNSNAGSFKGNDTAYVRIDNGGERTVLCGWLRLDKAGASMRAKRWLSEAHLRSGHTEQAIEHGIEGTVSVRCVVDIQGQVHDCTVQKSLPFMDLAVIHALEARKYHPALSQGKPVDVFYTFNVRLKLPEQ